MNSVADSNARWVPLAEVHRWAKNPRINKDAIPKVAESIRRFGFVSPVIVWPAESRVVAGHTRVAALESILAIDPGFVPSGAPAGVLPGMVPVRFHAFASEAEATSYAIADNRLNELARWDTDLLPELLGGLDKDLAALTGFVVELPDMRSVVLPDSAPSPTPSTERFAHESMSTVGGATEPRIRFGKVSLRMLPDDETWLAAEIERHKQETGTYDGFVGRLRARLRP